MLYAQLAIDRNLFFGHVRAVVIHQDIAQRGMLSLVNPMLQSHITPRETWLFSSNPARDVLENSPALDAIPSTYFSNFFENNLLLNRPYEMTLGGFHQRLVTPGIQPFAMWIGRGDKELSAPSIAGLAAFWPISLSVGSIRSRLSVGYSSKISFQNHHCHFHVPLEKMGSLL